MNLSHEENATVSTRWNIIDDLKGTGRGERRGPRELRIREDFVEIMALWLDLENGWAF